MKFLVHPLVESVNKTITDPADVTWRSDDIYVSCALVCIVTMVAFTAVSLTRIAQLPRTVDEVVPEKSARPAPLSKPSPAAVDA
jgi:hypothetical protein